MTKAKVSMTVILCIALTSVIVYTLHQTPKSPEVKLIDINLYGSATPEYIVMQFLAAWQKQDWESMAVLTSKQWQRSHPKTAQDLKRAVGEVSIQSAKIVHEQNISLTKKAVVVDVVYMTDKPNLTGEIRAIVSRQEDAGGNSPRIWTVDPATVDPRANY